MRVLFIILMLILATLACRPPPAVVVTGTVTPPSLVVACTPPACPEGQVPFCPHTCPGGCGLICVTPTPLPSPEITPPIVEATPTEPITPPGCILEASWVADVTVPDGTVFSPGTSFVKTWRVRNSGTCAWAPGTKLVFVSGNPMGGPPAEDVPALAPGAQTDVSVSFTAPTTPGTYRANYQLQAPDGTRFGSIIWVQIVVPGTPTPTPVPVCTPPPCPPGMIIICPTPGACPGNCGLVCVTPTPDYCVPVDPALELIIERARKAGVSIGCPTGPAISVYGTLQKFETIPKDPYSLTPRRSFMIWRSDERKIYIVDPGGMGREWSEHGYLITRGMWFGEYEDTWDESQPEVHPACAGMSVPPGFQLPLRGFGKVWCEDRLWEDIGWPREPEWGVNLLIQPTDRGVLIWVSGSPDGFHYLFALTPYHPYRTGWISIAFRP